MVYVFCVGIFSIFLAVLTLAWGISIFTDLEWENLTASARIVMTVPTAVAYFWWLDKKVLV